MPDQHEQQPQGESQPPLPIPPPAPPAPPTQRERFIPVKQQPGWPILIGIIVVVLGAMSLLGGCIGFSSALVPGIAGAYGDEAELQTMREWFAYVLISSGVFSVLAILQIAGGVGLLLRKVWAIRVIWIWAILKMLAVVGNIVPSYYMQLDQFQAMEQQTGSMPGGMESVMLGIIAIGLILGLVWSWALPVFLLVWFSREKVKAEIATWR